LVANLAGAAKELSVRTVVNPRVGYRYVATLASQVVKTTGGLLLHAIVTTAEEPAEAVAERSNVRAIA
jgi:hypothetical protein